MSSHAFARAFGVRARLTTAVAVTIAAVVAPLMIAGPAQAADTSAPSKPSSLAAAYYGGVGTVLTWGKVSASDLKAYRVYRSTSSSMTAANSTLVSETSAIKFTDAAAPAGTKLYYAVSAVDTSGNASALSSNKSITTTDTTKPSSPSSLKATGSATGIALDWKDNSEVDLAGYRVERAASSSGPWTIVTDLVVTSAYTDTAAPASVKSYYRVTARDLTGNASSSTSANATRTGTVIATAPATPGNFAATLNSAQVPALSWAASTGATTYSLARSTSADGPYTTISSTLTGTSYTDGAAPAQATVFYRLTAVNAVGASAPATTSIAVPGDTVPPASPSSPKATVIKTGGMTLSWKANTEADLAGYIVLKRDRDAGGYVPYLGSAAAPLSLNSFNDLTIAEGTVAYFRVQAVDTSGNVSKNYLAITANNPNVKPGTPSNLKVTQDPTAGLAISWKAPADLDIAGYTVYRNTSSGSAGWGLLENLTVEQAGANPVFRDTSAPKGVTMYYRVVAVDAVGNLSSNSSTVSGTSLTNPLPLPVVETVLTVGPGAQFATIGAAVASVPDNNLKRFRIDIAPGTYNEIVRVRSSYITLNGTGANPADTVIASAQASGSADPADPTSTLGTAGSYVVFVDAPNVTLHNLTVANTFDEAANPQITSQQAVALRVEGDRFVGDTIRLIGNQDTLLADTPKPTTRIRQYYVDSYIEGDVDYVFGAANAVFDRVTFRSLDRSKSNNGYVTAASTDKGSKYGFLIWDSKITSTAAAGSVNLGRPWHPSADVNAQGSVVVMNTWLSAAIDAAAPWDEMSSRDSSGTSITFPWTTGRFSEYGNFGPGATVNAMRPQLVAKDAAKITPAIQLAGSDGWNPVVAASNTVPSAPTGLTAATDLSVVNLSWADDESANVIGWNVYRADAAGAFTRIGAASSPSYADTTAITGSSYRYLVRAVARGDIESASSAELAITVAEAAHEADFFVDPTAQPSANTFPTVTAALAAAPAGTALNPTVIQIAAGRYQEYPTITKAHTILRGAGDASAVVLTGDRAAGTPTGTTTNGVADTYGTSGSASVVITANDVRLLNLTVENAYVEGTYANGQAVALRTTGDRIRLENVRLLGNQDTFYANSANRTATARVYVYNSFIQGDVDFIFGRATVVVDRSTLYVTDHGTSPNGAITAASTNEANPFGFLITSSRVIGDAPDASQNLGRPWQPGITQPDGTSVRDSGAIAQVVVRDTWLGPIVSPTAWTDMTNSGFVTEWETARFAEYANSGPGASTATDRRQLTDAEASGFTSATYLAGADGWNPVAVATPDAAPAAPTGVTAAGIDRKVSLDWADSPEPDAVTYRVYAADSANVPVDAAHLIAEVGRSTYVEPVPANGLTRFYTVVAVDRAGNASDASLEVSATSVVPPLVADLTVAQDGSGDFTTVQAALAAAPVGTSADPTVIVVEPGTYREVVSSGKANLRIVGATGDPDDVSIVFGNANGTATSAATCPFVTNSATCGTFGSATATLTGAGVLVESITIANDFSREANPSIVNTQAVALRATGDRQVFRNVRLLGHQDTLNADAGGNISANGSGYPRQYYVDSYIEGDVDFVFGRASAAFERVTFHALERSGGVVFAPSTASKAKGYLVANSRFSSDNDAGSFFFGRPWRAWSDGAYADDSRGQVVIRDSYVAAGFNANHPWTDMAPLVWSDGRFFEYGNTGPGVAASADRPLLSGAQADAATVTTWLSGTDSWNPDVSAVNAAPTAPSGLTARAGSGQVLLDWTESIESDVRAYRVYRDGALLTTVSDSDYRDTSVVDGTAYSYTVSAVDASDVASAQTGAVSATLTLKIDATVAADGSGDYATLTDAIAAASAGWVIQVAPGTYTGTTVVGKSVTIVGAADPAAVVLTNATTTATVSVTSANVVLRGLTIQNTTAAGTAPALSMTADKILVQNAVLSSAASRTVFADTPTYTASARQLITGSVISGGSDMFLGRATLVVHDSVIKPRTSATILTPSTASTFAGFLVIDSTVDTTGVSDVRLGRPYRAWGDTFVPNSVGQAIIRDTELGVGIRTGTPWMTGPAGEPVSLGRFAEYGNTGAGARVDAGRPVLSPAESLNVTVEDWLGAPTWYPAVMDPAAPADAEAPAPVTALTATAGDASAVLAWTAPVAADLAGYRVYRSTGTTVATSPANLVATLGLTDSYAATGLANGTAYTFALVPFDTAGNAGTATSVSVTPLDTLPPAAPAGLVVVPGNAKATLSWTANAEADLATYRVFRDGVQVADVPAGTTTYVDAGLTNGTTYVYTLTALDTLAHESGASASASVAPAEGDAVAPAAPTNVKAELGKGSISLGWAAPADDDVAQYRVTRNGTQVATVAAPATTWTDTTVAIGTTYSYAVTAVDGSENVSAVSASDTATAIKVDIVVAADGSGDATTIQAVLGTPLAGNYDAANPGTLANNADYSAQGFRTILVKPGTYTGPFVSGNRYGVRLVGSTGDAKDVVLTAPGSAVATFAVSGNQWTFRDLTLESVATSAGSQATALQVKGGDKTVVENARLIGDGKLFLVSTASNTTYGRVYVHDSYLQGGADMLLGRAVLVIDRSTIRMLDRPGNVITDSSVNAAHPFGFLITDSTITSDAAAGSIYLGRPYPESGVAQAQVVVRNTALPAAINPAQPWKDYSTAALWTSGRFFEYLNSGAGAGTGANRPQLSDTDAAGYTAVKYLAGTDGWNPVP